jgi:hypothetical protein
VLLSKGLIIEVRIDACVRESVPVLPLIVLRIERVDKFDVNVAKFPALVLMPARVLCCV